MATKDGRAVLLTLDAEATAEVVMGGKLLDERPKFHQEMGDDFGRLGRNGGTQQRFREVRKWEIISEGDSKHSMGRWGFEWDSQQSLWGFNEARQSMYGGA